MRSVGKGKSMTDVEKEIDELQGKLSAKTREIEALLAEELNLGNIHAMEGATYARLRTYVEELIEKWQQANVDHSGSNPDTAVNRLLTPSARRSRSKLSHCKCDERSRQRSALAHPQNRWQRLSLQRVSFRLAIRL